MQWMTQHVLIVLGVLVVALAVVFVLQQRRTPQSAAAWVLFMVLVPYVAVPLFVMLGFRKQGSRYPPVTLTPADPRHRADSPDAALLTALGAPQATGGNHLILLDNPESARRALQDLIDAAQETLDIELYIIAPDAEGEDFVRRLTQKARAGVKVRLNLDRLGTLFRPRAALAALLEAGGELRFFSPFLHPPDNGHMNLRNHRKLVIADGAHVWAGGRNIGDHYLGPADRAWTDLSFRLSGPAVQPFLDVFASDWDVTGRGPAPVRPHRAGARGDAVLQVVPAGPDEPHDCLYLALTTLIHQARRRVWISSPYFVPTEPLQLALTTAARKGVDVRILLPQRSNQRIADIARGPYLRDLQDAGATILRHPRMLHAKAGLIDDTGWVGSANFDIRSLLLNFELALFCHDTASTAALDAWFAANEAACTRGLAPARLPRRVLEGVFRLGAPML